MANLAIKGHATRGKEVIAILEMLGGINVYDWKSDDEDSYYCIGTDYDGEENVIIPIEDGHPNHIYFTLEEFLEKFPYKVGDKVLARGSAGEITDMKWQGDSFFSTKEGGEVVYTVMLDTEEEITFLVEELQPYKEETMKSKPNLLLQQLKEDFDNTPRDVLEKEWNELSYLNEIGPTVNEYLECVKRYRQSNQYPKTFIECCEVLSLGEDGKLYTKGYKASLIQDFHKLLICRDAYWKIAGEQMGLGKPWEPDWADTETDKYVIEIVKNTITIHDYPWNETNHILAFPTKGMRDAFYENFKDLINNCKELL